MCKAESVASLAPSLGNDVNGLGPLGGCVLGLPPRGWLDSPGTGACGSGLAGVCISTLSGLLLSRRGV